MYILNVDISFFPLFISTNVLPVIDNINMEGTLSHILDIGSKSDFIAENAFFFLLNIILFIILNCENLNLYQNY